MSNKLVSINEFIKRQTKNSGKTYTTLSFKDLAFLTPIKGSTYSSLASVFTGTFPLKKVSFTSSS